MFKKITSRLFRVSPAILEQRQSHSGNASSIPDWLQHRICKRHDTTATASVVFSWTKMHENSQILALNLEKFDEQCGTPHYE